MPSTVCSFYDYDAPIYTMSRFLPPSKVADADISNSILGDGTVIRAGCKIHHSVVGLRSLIQENCTVEDTLLMGSDYYETLEECALIPGCLPMGLGEPPTPPCTLTTCMHVAKLDTLHGLFACVKIQSMWLLVVESLQHVLWLLCSLLSADAVQSWQTALQPAPVLENTCFAMYLSTLQSSIQSLHHGLTDLRDNHLVTWITAMLYSAMVPRQVTKPA